MAQGLLDDVDVFSLLVQVQGEGVPQGVDAFLRGAVSVPKLEQALVAYQEYPLLVFVMLDKRPELSEEVGRQRYLSILGVLDTSDEHSLILGVEICLGDVESFLSPGTTLKDEHDEQSVSVLVTLIVLPERLQTCF